MFSSHPASITKRILFVPVVKQTDSLLSVLNMRSSIASLSSFFEPTIEITTTTSKPDTTKTSTITESTTTPELTTSTTEATISTTIPTTTSKFKIFERNLIVAKPMQKLIERFRLGCVKGRSWD